MAKTHARKPRGEDEEKLQAVIAGLEKSFGGGVLQTVEGNPSLQRFSRQIPSGSVNLDIALGVMFRRPNGAWQTGYAPGRIIEIFGNEGCGKTTLTLLMIANAQALGIRCEFLDMEHALDVNYAQTLGVNLSELYLAQPASGEQCLQIADTLLKSDMFSLIIIDSVAALVPQAELDGEIGDSFVGVQARLMSQSLRAMNTHLSKGVQCNLVFTNQMREKIGVKFGSPKTTPGGKALKFYANIRIEIWREGQLAEGENVYGHKVGVNVIKNKSAPPFRQAKFDLIYGKGVDYLGELLDLGASRGLVQVSGAWYSMDKVRLGQGRRQAVEFLQQNRDYCYKIYDTVMTQIMAERGYLPDGTPAPGTQPIAPSSITTAFQPETQPGASDQKSGGPLAPAA